MIPNDLDTAVAAWNAMSVSRQAEMRFVWGHSFSQFQNRIGLKRPVRIVQLVRHPLLKVAGMALRDQDDLHTLYSRTLQFEFEFYQGRSLPTTSLHEFLDAHYVLGVTELMEETLFLLRSRLGVKTPMQTWKRAGAHADLDSNVFSKGLVESFTAQDYYREELRLYERTRARLLAECREAGFLRTPEFAACKRAAFDGDDQTRRWRRAFPQLFHLQPAVPRRVLRPDIFRRRLDRSHVVATTIRPKCGRWGLHIGVLTAELVATQAPDIARVFEINSRGLTFIIDHAGMEGGPNVLHLELDFPALAQGTRTLRCIVMGVVFFETKIQPDVCLQAFDVAISAETTEVVMDVLMKSVRTGLNGPAARIKRLAILQAPV